MKKKNLSGKGRKIQVTPWTVIQLWAYWSDFFLVKQVKSLYELTESFYTFFFFHFILIFPPFFLPNPKAVLGVHIEQVSLCFFRPRNPRKACYVKRVSYAAENPLASALLYICIHIRMYIYNTSSTYFTKTRESWEEISTTNLVWSYVLPVEKFIFPCFIFSFFYFTFLYHYFPAASYYKTDNESLIFVLVYLSSNYAKYYQLFYPQTYYPWHYIRIL